jgi:hypothetical protein
MKYSVEMGSGSMLYVHTTFINDRFRHSSNIKILLQQLGRL